MFPVSGLLLLLLLLTDVICDDVLQIACPHFLSAALQLRSFLSVNHSEPGVYV